MQKRQEKILSSERKGEITYKELCSLFPDVSEMTLRRDLLHLEGERQLIRIRGGAKPVTHAGGLTEAAYQQRLLEQDVQKKRIALLAQAYIEQARSQYRLGNNLSLFCSSNHESGVVHCDTCSCDGTGTRASRRD